MKEARPNYLSKDEIFNTGYYIMPKIFNLICTAQFEFEKPSQYILVKYKAKNFRFEDRGKLYIFLSLHEEF